MNSLMENFYGEDEEKKNENYDEFAMFKARSLGVESELMEMARVGMFKKVSKQQISHKQNHKTNKLIGYHFKNNEFISNGVFEKKKLLNSDTNNKISDNCDPPENEKIESCLNRSHSQKVQRKQNGTPKITSLVAFEGQNEEKLTRQRNKTMPSRKKNTETDKKNFGNEEDEDNISNSSCHNNSNGRSVLRVRNFSVKDGNLVNRGDSIKIRRPLSQKNSCLSPLSKNKIYNFNVNTESRRTESFKEMNEETQKTHVAYVESPSDKSRHFSTSTIHLNNKSFLSPQLSDYKKRLSFAKTSRQIHSHDEDSVNQIKNNFVKSYNKSGSQKNQQNLKIIEIPSSSTSPSSANTKQTYYFDDSSKQKNLETEKKGKEINKFNIDEKINISVDNNKTHASDCLKEEGESAEDENGFIETQAKQEDDAVYKVVVIGMAGVGKTTLTHQMMTSEYLANKEQELDDDSPDKIVSVMVDSEESLLQFVDFPFTPGLKKKDIDNNHLIPSDAYIVVYSVTDRTSFNYAQVCLQELRPAKRMNAVILVANKQDLVRNRSISEDDGKSLAYKRHCKFIEVSALLDHKVDDLLVGVTRQIRMRKGLKENEKTDCEEGGFGCLHKATIDFFNRLLRRPRVNEGNSCDNLFKP